MADMLMKIPGGRGAAGSANSGSEAPVLGRIGKVESLTKAGKLVAYEGVVKMGTKRPEVQVGLTGEN
jgi:hypothetical protein